jgi:hypothetical protein
VTDRHRQHRDGEHRQDAHTREQVTPRVRPDAVRVALPPPGRGRPLNASLGDRPPDASAIDARAGQRQQCGHQRQRRERGHRDGDRRRQAELADEGDARRVQTEHRDDHGDPDAQTHPDAEGRGHRRHGRGRDAEDAPHGPWLLGPATFERRPS